MIKKIFRNSAKTSKDFINKSANKAQNTTKLSQSNESTDTSSVASKLYRSLSGRALNVAVKAKLLGDLPHLDVQSANRDDEIDIENIVTFYVLQDYSRSNNLLIDLQSKEYHLPRALQTVSDKSQQVYEKSAIIVLNPAKDKSSQILTSKLERLTATVRQSSNLRIRLIPVTIIWGRAPEKEDSLFKLFMADDWQEPSIAKQLFNIGVMGRDTFIQFHPAQDLFHLIKDLQLDVDGNPITDENSEDMPGTSLITNKVANAQIVHRVRQHLNVYLDKQRANILGPDLSDKRNVCDKILYSAAVKKRIASEVEKTGKSEKEIREQARKYLNEIVTDYSYSIVRFFENFLTWLWTQIYDGVEVQNFERVRDLASDHQIIYVPSHRSHIDYLLLSFVIYKKGLRVPSIAAGNNLNLPIVGQLLRNGGAFFMRRSFKDNPLYSTVFKEYLHSLIIRSNPIEYFVEGGRSRTGRLLPPKLGMISMTVQSYLRQSNRPIVFVPTYIGYERLMEGSTYIGELKGQPKEAESLIGVLKASRKLEKIFGTVHLNFGKPLFVDEFMTKFDVEPDSLPLDETDVEVDKNVQDMVENIGIKIMQNINRAAVVNPISLLSLVLLSTPKLALDESSCVQQVKLYQDLVRDLPYDSDTEVTDMSAKEIIEYGIKLKLIERTPHILGDMIKVDKNQAALLSYFRNNVLHIYILSSFISALVIRNGHMPIDSVQRIISQLYPFLQAELFLKYSENSICEVVAERIESLAKHGLLIIEEDHVSAPEINSISHHQLEVLANPIEQSLERYIMTLTLLAEQGSGKLSQDQVIDLAGLLGQRLAILYADDMPDTFEKALFISFVKTLIRLGYVENDKENDVLIFDERINNIAVNAKYILNPDIMKILHKVADLEEKQIIRVTADLKAKKQNKFRRKKS